MNVGSVLRKRRAELGLRQKHVAERVGITEDYLGLIERGQRSPSTDLLDRLARELGVPVSWLILESEPINPNLPIETAKVVEEARRVAGRLLNLIDKLQDQKPPNGTNSDSNDSRAK